MVYLTRDVHMITSSKWWGCTFVHVFVVLSEVVLPEYKQWEKPVQIVNVGNGGRDSGTRLEGDYAGHASNPCYAGSK